MANAGETVWIAVLGNITGYEFVAPEGQMLSHAYARFKAKHPILTRAVLIITILHLEDLLPRRLDPFQIGLWHWARRLEQIAA